MKMKSGAHGFNGWHNGLLLHGNPHKLRKTNQVEMFELQSLDGYAVKLQFILLSKLLSIVRKC